MIDKREQGVLHPNKLINLFVKLLLLALILRQNISSETLAADTASHENNEQVHHVFILSSSDGVHYASIIKNITDGLNLSTAKFSVSTVIPEKNIENIDHKNDLIIGIGHDGMSIADKNYPAVKKLFISTDPHKYQLDKNKNKDDAILYMTQPYCRQIKLIKYFTPDWRTISILNSQEKPVDTATIRRCANRYYIRTYIVSTNVEENLTNKIKHALSHSDVLLALPDSTIYNKKNIKNILLTSYRYRKPVIGFSENFVNAGALASINSSTEQIAHSAVKLIEQYFDSDHRFIKQVNYPDDFDININKQVSRALNITIPDIDKLKDNIEQVESNRSGKSQ